MSILGFTLWSVACFAAGALWTKSKAEKIDPELKLSLSSMAEEDAKAAVDYIKEKAAESKAKQQ